MAEQGQDEGDDGSWIPFFEHDAPLPDQVCPFIPARDPTLEILFGLLPVRSSDRLLDLGCGDGAIMRFAARKFSIKCKGIDINQELLAKGARLARDENLHDLCEYQFLSFTSPAFSFWTVCDSPPTIITSYLIPDASLLFKEKMEQYLRDSDSKSIHVHVLSIAFKLYNWIPVAVGDDGNTFLYNYSSVPSSASQASS